MKVFKSGRENLKRKNIRKAKYDDIDSAFYKWFCSARMNNIPGSGILLKEKASVYAEKLKINEFVASNGWFDRWKTRNNISFKIIAAEEKSCTEEMVAPWTASYLPTILSRYKLEDIYNADEFGLFYRMLPAKTMNFKSEKCSGGKLSKQRITGLAAANAVGDKLPLLIIGKSTKHRCFKNIKQLPCVYKSQKKSWMDSKIFVEWVRKLDRRFTTAERKVALVIDNCPSHPHVINDLSAIDIIFLPPNTTSILQPMRVMCSTPGGKQVILDPLYAIFKKYAWKIKKNRPPPPIYWTPASTIPNRRVRPNMFSKNSSFVWMKKDPQSPLRNIFSSLNTYNDIRNQLQRYYHMF